MRNHETDSIDALNMLLRPLLDTSLPEIVGKPLYSSNDGNRTPLSIAEYVARLLENRDDNLFNLTKLKDNPKRTELLTMICYPVDNKPSRIQLADLGLKEKDKSARVHYILRLPTDVKFTTTPSPKIDVVMVRNYGSRSTTINHFALSSGLAVLPRIMHKGGFPYIENLIVEPDTAEKYCGPLNLRKFVSN